MSFRYGWRPYVPVAQRRANAARQLAKRATKSGQKADPVCLPGRQIATSFWGKAWCDNLEAYSDFANRLPRGRTYVRNGSVVDLQIAKGRVTAMVSGSELYQIEIEIRPLEKSRWAAVQKDCAGKIDSLLELLQGRLSAAVMSVVTRPSQGLFPTPKEIKLKCSCPDWAEMCKHVAATLYGVGARLDTRPELLFLLRGVDPEELIAGVSGSDALGAGRPTDPTAAKALAGQDLADVFGIELEAATTTPKAPKAPKTAKASAGKPQARAAAKPKAGARAAAKAPPKATAPRPLRRTTTRKTAEKPSPPKRPVRPRVKR